MSILRTETKRLVTLTLGKYKAVVAKHENEYDEFVTKYYNDGYYMKTRTTFRRRLKTPSAQLSLTSTT
jgi:hypothetical protein